MCASQCAWLGKDRERSSNLRIAKVAVHPNSTEGSGGIVFHY